MEQTADNIKGQRALLRFLQRQGRISAADSLRLEQISQRDNLSINEVLEREAVISERDLAVLLAETLRLAQVDLGSFPLDPAVARILRESIAVKYGVVAIRHDERTIEVATFNPLDLEALKAVEFATGRRAQAVVASRSEVQDALAHAYRLEESLDKFLQNVPAKDKVTISSIADDKTDLRAVKRDAELPPVIKLADLILAEGIKTEASDIHLEPCPDGVAVRYRIDGILEEGFRFPKWVQSPLTSRFKVMARLDITERRVPQDGRISVRYADSEIDLRVSSLPMQHGEKITLRVLDAARAIRELSHLGLRDVDAQRIHQAAMTPEGMILITGPTGSGKTTTLYAVLKEIYSPTKNIVTIENPIEYQLPGINQVEINEKQGLNFASVLRSALRQDPDVILVGEIRDRETALIAMQAAQTGHLVLSTLHTNDAPATITRLLDLGVEPYVVASSLNLIVAQRLVRRVCTRCSAPYDPPDESRRLLRLDDFRKEFRRGLGCPECRQSGYSGRSGVYEVVPVSPAMAQLIESGAGETSIRQQARADGCVSLLEDALEKLARGVTTAEEVLRVVQVNENAPRCPSCQEDVDDSFSVCPHCGQALRINCRGCGKNLSGGWRTCPYCGDKVQGEAVPAAPPAAVPAAVPAEDPPPASAAASSPPAVAGRRPLKALVADDDPDLRRIVRMTLEGAGLGLTVITAQDGAEALALVDIERPDVVLLDLCMPKVDGFEVCRRLRADVRMAFVPILMLTAKDNDESVSKGFQVGTDDYIVKPFRRQDLISRVCRMLERTYGKDVIEVGGAAAASGEVPAVSARLRGVAG